MEDSTGKVIFTGDTLFHGGECDQHLVGLTDSSLTLLLFEGCGRFFEGTAEEMHTALNQTLAAVPDDTTVYVCTSLLKKQFSSV
jgi:hydroxyacylglutathione hydrolase